MITTRPFANSDAKALVEIYRHSVTEIGPNAYNPEQAAVWTKLYQALEAQARKQDIGKLYSEASEFAKSFLLKQDF